MGSNLQKTYDNLSKVLNLGYFGNLERGCCFKMLGKDYKAQMFENVLHIWNAADVRMGGFRINEEGKIIIEGYDRNPIGELTKKSILYYGIEKDGKPIDLSNQRDLYDKIIEKNKPFMEIVKELSGIGVHA